MGIPRISYPRLLYYGDSVALFSGLIIERKNTLFIESVVLCLELCYAFFMGI